MGTVSLVIKTNRDTTQFVQSGQSSRNLIGVRNLVEGLLSGSLLGSVDIFSSTSDPVAATATATLVSCATDTITIGGVTFTGAASPSGEAQFATSGTDAADATALAAKIAAHSTLGKIVTATSASNVVTITALIKGVVGNFIAVSRTGTTITLSGALLAGGTGGPASTPVSIGR